MSVRDKIRAASVGAKKNFRSELVTWGEGEDAIEVEIRQPSVKERRQLMRAVTDETGEIDGQELLIWAVINQTYVPGTNEKVYDASDYDSLVSSPTGSYVDRFGQVALEVMNVADQGKGSNVSEETADSKTS